MSKVIFVDLNEELVNQMKELGVPSYHSDYFKKASEIENAVLMTASNPRFTFGGGIDAGFYQNYRGWCLDKQERGGGNERIGNICFVISVDSHYKVDEQKVREAIQFALENTHEDETLLLHGIGTGIGGLKINKLVEIIKELVV